MLLEKNPELCNKIISLIEFLKSNNNGFIVHNNKSYNFCTSTDTKGSVILNINFQTLTKEDLLSVTIENEDNIPSEFLRVLKEKVYDIESELLMCKIKNEY